MRRVNKGLFGGALLTAGLTAGGAQAQQFQIGYTAAHLSAYETGYFNFDTAYQYASGDFGIAVSASSGYAYGNGALSMNGSGMSASANAGSFSYFGYAFSHNHDLFTEFTVDQNFNATVSWDFTNANSPFTNYLIINDVNLGTVFSAYDDAGSTQLALSAGTTYQMFAQADVTASGQGSFGSSWWNIAVPTPGGAALLGLAGLTAARRRRTCQRVQ